MNLGYSTAISIMSQAGSLTLTFEDSMKHYRAVVFGGLNPSVFGALAVKIAGE